MADELLNRTVDPFKFILTYKFSQHHIKLLFSCIRARGGSNNNPNTIQFKSTLRQILMHNSIAPSNKSNVLSFEETYNGCIFSLKTSRRQSPASEIMNANFPDEDEVRNTDENPRMDGRDAEDNQYVMEQLFVQDEPTIYQENVLYYITGYIIKQMMKELTCHACLEAIIVPVVTLEHQYSCPSYARLVARKDMGSLMKASHGAFKVIEQAEKSFYIHVLLRSKSKITTKKISLQMMVLEVLQSFNWTKQFPSIDGHRFDVEAGYQDDHLTQIVKRLALRYLTLRLKTYGLRYTRRVVKRSMPSKRHLFNKMTLFMNI